MSRDAERDRANSRVRAQLKRKDRKAAGLCSACGKYPLRCKNFCLACGADRCERRRLARKTVVRPALDLSQEERYALMLLRPQTSTQEAIGQALRLSRARVQQIEAFALKKLLSAVQQAGW